LVFIDLHLFKSLTDVLLGLESGNLLRLLNQLASPDFHYEPVFIKCRPQRYVYFPRNKINKVHHNVPPFPERNKN